MPRNRGFTLIELMIVVAIIGILAAIAVPKFASLLRKSREGAARGSLGTIRSALTIYYSDMEGLYPSDLDSLTISGKYVNVIPTLLVADYHPSSIAIEDNDDWGMAGLALNDRGRWLYWNWTSPSNGRSQGDVWIGCTHTDTKSSAWTSY